MSLVALIPARSGSKGIPKKNTKDLKGKPLIAYSIESALRSQYIDKVVVTTDSHEIAKISKLYGAEVPFLRPPELARDDSSTIETVLHALNYIKEAKQILLLQPTSPLRNTMDIEGIIKLQKSLDAESVISVTRQTKHPEWMFSLSPSMQLKSILPINKGEKNRRQDLDPVYVLNGAMYLCKVDWINTHRSFVGKETVAYQMPIERSVDIDTPLDWLWAETLLEAKN